MRVQRCPPGHRCVLRNWGGGGFPRPVCIPWRLESEYIALTGSRYWCRESISLYQVHIIGAERVYRFTMYTLLAQREYIALPASHYWCRESISLYQLHVTGAESISLYSVHVTGAERVYRFIRFTLLVQREYIALLG